MPFGPAVYSQIEDALAGIYQFHNALDTFLLRSGVSKRDLDAARQAADAKAKASLTKNYSRAPKRFVAQELLNILSDGSDESNRIVARVVTALTKGKFPEASAEASKAIRELIEQAQADKTEAKSKREQEAQRAQGEERARQEALEAKVAKRSKFKEMFLSLYALEDVQARGYMLEKFLNEFLEFEQLNPRASFRLIGEQIDGSFLWAGRTYLVEARWVREPVGGAGFAGLMYKIEGKTADTRGLFISVNGYSPEALSGLRLKGDLRFACIDGAHLIRCLAPGGSFSKLMEVIWRHASETGEAYLPVNRMTPLTV